MDSGKEYERIVEEKRIEMKMVEVTSKVHTFALASMTLCKGDIVDAVSTNLLCAGYLLFQINEVIPSESGNTRKFSDEQVTALIQPMSLRDLEALVANIGVIIAHATGKNT
mgnify:CR=1 FL=1